MGGEELEVRPSLPRLARVWPAGDEKRLVARLMLRLGSMER